MVTLLSFELAAHYKGESYRPIYRITFSGQNEIDAKQKGPPLRHLPRSGLLEQADSADGCRQVVLVKSAAAAADPRGR